LRVERDLQELAAVSNKHLEFSAPPTHFRQSNNKSYGNNYSNHSSSKINSTKPTNVVANMIVSQPTAKPNHSKRPDSLPLDSNGHLTEAEKQRRQDEGLCKYCGSADHERVECPVKRRLRSKGSSKSGVIANITFEKEESKNDKTQ
jgi:hypothetical protein